MVTTSSESSRSLMAVKPRRSVNIAVTSRRSPPRRSPSGVSRMDSTTSSDM